ncbi:MAG: TetR family transcriptional regulator C-terminal domain-containing protein [Microbacteriaceae bacterium]|nr:TetR family transcriptional regulator C-terminal domain-containing protein [Microbacteriaceae bacterium]
MTTRTQPAGDGEARVGPAPQRNDAQLALLRRSQILCASVRIVGRDGALGARLKDIANEAGVSLGLVQHYFGSRQELLEETFRVMLRVSLERVYSFAGIHEDPLLSLIAMLRLHAYGSVDFSERWGFWVELWSSARRDPVHAEIAHEVYTLWTTPFESAVRRLQETGRCRDDIEAQDAAIRLMGLIDGLAVRTLVDPSVMDVESLYRMLVDAATRQLGLDPAETEVIVAHLDSSAVTPRTSGAPLTPDVIARALAGS